MMVSGGKMMVCQICGDTGWLGALVFCNLCQSIAEHSYCLDQSKTTTVNEEIRWVCEFCESSIIELSDSTDQSSEPQPFQSLARPRSPLDSKESLHTVTKVVQTLSLCKDRKNNRDKGKCIVEDVQFSGRDSADNSQESSPSSEDDFLDTIEPLPDYRWRGRFCVYGKYSCTILAHMSNEACTEASEVISSLPTLLGLEIVPKINIWPIKFRNMVPTADNISVYFFPENYSAERVYDRLVDYLIEHELAMISKIHDVELLVFSSRELHLNDWRYQRKYYLWGILRRKKKLLPQNQSDNHTSSQHGSISYSWPSGSTAEIGAKDNEDGRGGGGTKGGLTRPLASVKISDFFSRGCLMWDYGGSTLTVIKGRPTAKEAVMMLTQELPVPGLPAKKPNLELQVHDQGDDKLESSLGNENSFRK